MVSANKEMVVYCFDTLVAHYNSEEAPPPAFDEGQHPLFVTWKKEFNGGEPRLRGCIGTLEPHCLIDGLRDYALTRRIRFHFMSKHLYFDGDRVAHPISKVYTRKEKPKKDEQGAEPKTNEPKPLRVYGRRGKTREENEVSYRREKAGEVEEGETEFGYGKKIY